MSNPNDEPDVTSGLSDDAKMERTSSTIRKGLNAAWRQAMFTRTLPTRQQGLGLEARASYNKRETKPAPLAQAL